jgi:hypothetical protein
MKFYSMQHMKKPFSYLLIIMLMHSAVLLAGDYNLMKRIPIKAQVFTTDHFGNAYVVAGGNIFKYDSIGNLAATFSQKDLGSPQSIDATDPMKILVFYSNFAIIRILDTKLALQSTIDLRAIGIQQPILACNTINQSGFWVYDENDFMVKKINDQLKVEISCLPLNKIFHDVHVNFILESESWVMLNNPALGVIVFDKTGDYFHTIEILDLTSFQAQYDQIFFVKNDSIITCNIGSLERNGVKLPPMKGVIDARVEPHRMFLKKADAIEIYSF